MDILSAAVSCAVLEQSKSDNLRHVLARRRWFFENYPKPIIQYWRHRQESVLPGHLAGEWPLCR